MDACSLVAVLPHGPGVFAGGSRPCPSLFVVRDRDEWDTSERRIIIWRVFKLRTSDGNLVYKNDIPTTTSHLI